MSHSQSTSGVRVRYLNDGRIGHIVGTTDEKTIVVFGTTVVHLLAWEFEVQS